MKLEWVHIKPEYHFDGAWMLGVAGTGLCIAQIERRGYAGNYEISFGIHSGFITRPTLADAVAWVRAQGGPDVPELPGEEA